MFIQSHSFFCLHLLSLIVYTIKHKQRMKQNLSDILKQVTKQEYKFIEQCTVRRVSGGTCDVEPIYSSDYNSAIGNPKNYYYDIKHPAIAPLIGSPVYVAFLSESEGIIIFVEKGGGLSLGDGPTPHNPVKVEPDKVTFSSAVSCEYKSGTYTHRFNETEAIHLDIEKFIVQTVGKSTLYISNTFNIVSNKPIFIGITDNVEYDKRNYTIGKEKTKSEKLASMFSELLISFNTDIRSSTTLNQTTQSLVDIINKYSTGESYFSTWTKELSGYPSGASTHRFKNKNIPDGLFGSLSNILVGSYNVSSITVISKILPSSILKDSKELNLTPFTLKSFDEYGKSVTEYADEQMNQLIGLMKGTEWSYSTETINAVKKLVDIFYYKTISPITSRDGEDDVISSYNYTSKYTYGGSPTIIKTSDLIEYVGKDTLIANLSLHTLLTEQNNLIKSLTDVVENLALQGVASFGVPLTAYPTEKVNLVSIINNAKQLQANIDKVLATKPDIA